MELKNYFLQDDQGNALIGATCYLYERGTESKINGLKKANGEPLPNPFVNDQALVQFAAPNGLYDLRVVKGAKDERIRLQFNDVAETAQVAVSAATRAETAVSVAMTAKEVSPDEPSGRPGKQNGEYFYSESADPNIALSLWRKINADSSQHVDDLPSKYFVQLVSALTQQLNSYFGAPPSGWAFLLNDAVGQGVFGARSTGEIVAGVLQARKLTSDSLNVTGGGVIGINEIPGYLFSLMNDMFEACFAVREDGTVQAGRMEVRTLISDLVEADNVTGQSVTLAGGEVIGENKIPGYIFALLNAFAEACLAVREDGTVVAGTIEANKIVVKTLEAESIRSPSLTTLADSIRRRLPDVPHIFGFGQSLVAGVNASPLQTVAARYNAVRFIGGARAQDGGADVAANHASFVPYVETTANTGDGTGHETPMGGALDCIYERLLDEHSGFQASDLMLLGSVPGQGGKTIAQLSKGHVLGYYDRILADIQYGYALAQAQGKTYEPVAAFWIQGESDQSAGTTKAAYKTALATLIDNVNADASALLGFPVAVKWVTYMFNSWVNRTPNTAYPTIPLALQELAQERADLFVACPMYQFEYSDTSHLTGRSSKALGAYLGLAIKRVVFDEVEFAALGVIDHVKQGKVINVKFKPVGKLVFDTELVTNPGNYGFSLVDSAGTPLSIASVSIRYDMVSVVAAATIPAGAKLRYAFIGGTTGQLPSRTTGPRGCLRDSQGDQMLFDQDGVNWPLHNWAMPFELPL